MDWFILLAASLGVAAIGFIAGAIVATLYNRQWRDEIALLHGRFDAVVNALKGK